MDKESRFIVYCPSELQSHWRFVFEFLFESILNSEIELCSTDETSISIKLAGSEKGELKMLAPTLPEEVRGSTLTWMETPTQMEPFDRGSRKFPIYAQGSVDSVASREFDLTCIEFDLIGGMFRFLSLYDERKLNALDENGRRTFADRRLLVNGFIPPYVNYYAEILAFEIDRLWPSCLKRTYPKPRLSFDIDNPFEKFGDGICRNFDYLLKKCGERGIRADFYVVAGRSSQKYDPRYLLSDTRMISLLRSISEGGHYIHLHASYNAMMNKARLCRERRYLMAVLRDIGIDGGVAEVRAHFLRWMNESSWRNCREVGFSVDSSLGYADIPGFRQFCSWGHPTFLHGGRQNILMERPLAFMDATIMDGLMEGTECLAAKEKQEKMRGVFDRLGWISSRFGGAYSILWHNERLRENEWRELFEDSLRLIGT